MAGQTPGGDAPAPGDPRDPGPRPQPTGRDLAWALLAGVIALLTAVQVLGLGVAVVRLEQPVTTGGLVLGFLVTIVWLLTIWWLVVGAWRRSVWGCPFQHTVGARETRRCQRHALVPGDDPLR